MYCRYVLIICKTTKSQKNWGCDIFLVDRPCAELHLYSFGTPISFYKIFICNIIYYKNIYFVKIKCNNCRK